MKTMEFRRYVFPVIESNMYVCISGPCGLVIDPHVSGEALAELESRCVKSLLILLTHEHYDHTSGVSWLAGKIESTVICQSVAAASLKQGRNNRPIVLAAKYIDNQQSDDMRAYLRSLPNGYVYSADRTFDDETAFNWQDHRIRMVHTPGHSPGSCCIEIDGCMTATGDSLLPHAPVITRFPGGSAEEYERCTAPYLSGIADGTLVLPGHGEPFLFHAEAWRARWEKAGDKSCGI